MSVLIVFAVWFVVGYLCFLAIKDDECTNWEMIITTCYGPISVFLIGIGWLITSDWSDKPYK